MLDMAAFGEELLHVALRDADAAVFYFKPNRMPDLREIHADAALGCVADGVVDEIAEDVVAQLRFVTVDCIGSFCGKKIEAKAFLLRARHERLRDLKDGCFCIKGFLIHCKRAFRRIGTVKRSEERRVGKERRSRWSP